MPGGHQPAHGAGACSARSSFAIAIVPSRSLVVEPEDLPDDGRLDGVGQHSLVHHRRAVYPYGGRPAGPAASPRRPLDLGGRCGRRSLRARTREHRQASASIIRPRRRPRVERLGCGAQHDVDVCPSSSASSAAAALPRETVDAIDEQQVDLAGRARSSAACSPGRSSFVPVAVFLMGDDPPALRRPCPNACNRSRCECERGRLVLLVGRDPGVTGRCALWDGLPLVVVVAVRLVDQIRSAGRLQVLKPCCRRGLAGGGATGDKQIPEAGLPVAPAAPERARQVGPSQGMADRQLAEREWRLSGTRRSTPKPCSAAPRHRSAAVVVASIGQRPSRLTSELS